MGNISIVKIADVAKYRKDFITIDNHKDYKRCRVQLHKRGVLLRDIVKGNYIKTKKQRVCKKDDFIFAEMDAKFGGYGIIPKELEGAVVSSHYYLFELDRSKVLPDYLSVLIDTDVIQSQIKAKGSTNYSRVSPSEVLEFEIPCPHIEEQKRVISFYLNAKNTLLQLNEENIIQQKYFLQLRQSILQDAIEGKLTVEWRKKNLVKKGDPETDAAALLEKIRAEKEKLIKVGKIRKAKPLPPIKEEEHPFPLPPSWQWTRLGEVCTKITDGFHNTPPKLTSGKIYISATHIREQGINWDGCLYVSEKDHNDLFKKAYPQKGEILITNRGAGCGTPALIDIDENFSFQNAALIGFNQSLILSKYIHNFLLFMRKTITDEFVNGGLQPMLSNAILNTIPVPIPPIAEQRAIVERVDELSGIVDELEKEAAARQTLSENLMQAVLKEAFEGGGEI